MTNLHIHSVIQLAFTYQIHSIIFIFRICQQIFEFLPFHILMEIISRKISKIGLIIFWHKSAPFPPFPVSGSKNRNRWLRKLCLSWLSPSLTPHNPPAINFNRFLPPISYEAHPHPHCFNQDVISCWKDHIPSRWHLLLLISPPHHHQNQSSKMYT